jgi:hypothetical protein
MLEKEEILLSSFYLLQVTLPENALQGELSWRGADHVECEIHRRCVDNIHWREKEEVYLEIRKYSLWNTASNIKMKETTSRAQRRAIEGFELVWSQMKNFS